MECGAGGQAKGAVHSRNSPGTGHSQRHGQEIHERQKSAYDQASTHIQGFMTWYDRGPSWWHLCWSLTLTFILSGDTSLKTQGMR